MNNRLEDNKKEKLGFVVVMALVSIILVVVLFGGALKLYGAVVSTDEDSDNYIMSYKPIIVVSGSMLPSIQINSINIVKRCSIDDLTIGDVVMYKADNGMLITHRVAEFIEYNGNKALIAKGDNNENPDQLPVKGIQVRGKIVFTWNAIAPILTDIVPTHGAFNAMSIIRAMLVLVLIVITISLVTKKVWEIAASIYYIEAGEPKFRHQLNLYKANLEGKDKIEGLIEQASQEITSKMGIMDKIKIGIARTRVSSSIKAINSELDILKEQAKNIKDIK